MSKFAFLTAPSYPRNMSAGGVLGLDYVRSRLKGDIALGITERPNRFDSWKVRDDQALFVFAMLTQGNARTSTLEIWITRA